jgi:streptogramin lyase
MRRMTAVLVVVALVAVLLTAAAQQHGKDQHRPQHAPLPDIKQSPAAKFVGTWQGTATHSMPGQAEPSEVDMVEKVQWKMGESALLIEGRGVMKDETGAEKVVHDAMAVIRFDPRTHKLMFHAFKVGEPANVAELELLDNGDMRWFLEPAPGRMVRFTISLTDDTWTEIGEFSPDGGVNYMPFMQMNLKRVE